MRNEKLLYGLLVMAGFCESLLAQGQISVGPVGGLQIRHQSYPSAPATYGLTVALHASKRLMLTTEYYTFANTQRIGPEGSTESLTVLEWRTDHRSHVVGLGFNYMPAGMPYPPRLLIGLHLGHEWLYSETSGRNILEGSYREFHEEENARRILVSPSLGFLMNWHKISTVFSLRYGTAVDRSDLSDKDDFGQMRIDVLLDLL